ncbi:MAG: hypothetical protein HQL24_04775 [Candidatus Omnitrophica bacterium]|nr:hypothetical protein [Candidatus Omnitrophota bacterium]
MIQLIICLAIGLFSANPKIIVPASAQSLEAQISEEKDFQDKKISSDDFIEFLRSTIKQKEVLIEELTEENGSLHKEILNLTDQKKLLENQQGTNLSGKLYEKIVQIENLNLQKESLSNQIIFMRQENTKLADEIKNLKGQLQESNLSRQLQLQDAQSSYDEKLSTLEQEVAKLKETIRQNNNLIEKYKEDQDFLKKNLADIELEKKTLSNDLDLAKERLGEKESKFTAQAAKEKKGLEKDINVLQQKLNISEQERQRKMEESVSLKIKKDALEQDLKSQSEETELNDASDKLHEQKTLTLAQKKTETLKKKILTLENKLERIQKKNMLRRNAAGSASIQDLLSIKNEMKILKRELLIAARERDRYEQALEDQQYKIKALNKNIVSLLDQLGDMKRSNTEEKSQEEKLLQKKVIDLQKDLTIKEQQISSLSLQMEKITADYKASKISLDVLNNQFASYKEESGRKLAEESKRSETLQKEYQTTLQDKENEIKDLKNTLALNKEQLNSLTQQKDRLAEDLKASKISLDVLNSQFTPYKEEAERKLAEEKKRSENLQKEYQTTLQNKDNEIKNLKNDLALNKEQLNSVTQQKDKLAVDFKTSKISLDVLNSQFNPYKEEAQKKIIDGRNALENLRKDYQILEQEKKNFSKRIEEAQKPLKEQISSLEQKLEAKENSTEEKVRKETERIKAEHLAMIEKLNQQLDQTQTDLSKKIIQFGTISREKENLAARIQALNKNKDVISSELQFVKQKLQETEKLLTEKFDQDSPIREKIKELQESVKNSQDLIALEPTEEIVQTALAEKINEIKLPYQEKIFALEKKVDTLTKDLAQKEAEIRSLTETLQKTQSECPVTPKKR